MSCGAETKDLILEDQIGLIRGYEEVFEGKNK